MAVVVYDVALLNIKWMIVLYRHTDEIEIALLFREVLATITSQTFTFAVCVNAPLYRYVVLKHYVVPLFQRNQDMRTLHLTTQVAMDFLAQKNVPVLPWPELSHYLSPIDH